MRNTLAAMKNYAVVLSLLVVAIAGCKSSSAPVEPQSVSNGSPQAQFDWKQYDEQTFEVKPGQTKAFAVPQETTRLRVMLSADSSVDAGVMSKAKFDSFHGDVPDHVGSENFRDLPCVLVAADKDEARCLVDPQVPSMFVVRDPRAGTSDPVAAVMGVKSTAETSKDQSVPPNKIKLTFYGWACTANCPVEQTK